MSIRWSFLQTSFNQALVLSVLLGQCLDAYAINNGIKVQPGDLELKTFVHVMTPHRYQSGKFQTCTGTIIDDRIILTAAHCLERISSEPFIEFIQTNEKNEVRQKRKVLDWVTFRRWDTEPNDSHQFDQWVKTQSFVAVQNLEVIHRSDIALIFLQEEIPNGFVKAHLPDRNFKVSVGLRYQIAGLGENLATDDFKVFYRTSLVVADIDKFDNFTSRYGPNSSMACAGDSGSAATIFNDKNEFIAIGVLSTAGWFCPGPPLHTFMNIQSVRDEIDLVIKLWRKNN